MAAHLNNKVKGFTLIELLVVVVIAAVLLSVAAPSFRDTIERNRIVSETNDLNAGLSFARSEAIRRNQVLSICASNAGGTACAADWSTGWMVWADADADSTFDAGEELRAGRIEAADDLAVVDGAGNAITQVSFGPRGTRVAPTDGASFTLKPDTCASGRPVVRRMIISAAGASLNMCIKCGTEGNVTPTRC